LKRLLLLSTVALLSGVPRAALADSVMPFPSAAAASSSGDDRSVTTGSVTVGGDTINYEATVGTLIVHAHDWDDSAQVLHDRVGDAFPAPKVTDDAQAPATASMSYVAYFKKGTKAENRPITFVYNGGPGSSTVWLHVGAFGPRRIVTNNDSHTPPAPYHLVNNAQSLLDVTDLVFIDAPGTGFGRIGGKDSQKAFWGVDADGHAFAHFIMQFLGIYGRFNSPKYLFGESYGTTRSAVVANDLENDESIDLNGVILMSQILNYDNNADTPEYNPGNDQPYVLALPTYAATAWYHHKLPNQPTDLKDFLAEVEHFASTDYLLALQQGASLPDDQRQAIAQKLHAYTGLSVPYILRADLRINGGEFTENLQIDGDLTTGRLDTRFSGPTVDPLSKESSYDPQSSALSSAYVSAFNDYVRSVLKYGAGQSYRAVTDAESHWDFRHQLPDQSSAQDGLVNVMPDLAMAMKTNPTLKVMLNAGYFDLATPYYEGMYEIHHLPMPASLQANVEFRQYLSGHMIYANEAALAQLHDNVADFIKRTDGQLNGPTAP